jgi:divalent metal cation (Fe/Co/Zn/Cd) transporter
VRTVIEAQKAGPIQRATNAACCRVKGGPKDVVHRLADGVDPTVITSAEAAAGSVDGVVHAHARARWTGRTLRVEVEGWVDPALTVSGADTLGQQVAQAVARDVPEAGSFTWTARAAPA